MKEPDPPGARVHELLAHQDFAFNLARRLVGDVHVAEDLVQQAWLRAIRCPPREDRGLRGWVTRVVVNLSRSRYRSMERHRRAELFAGRPETAEFRAELEASELSAILEQTLARISARQREAIRLRYYEGLPPREIARWLNVPLETVYTRLRRGLRELRRLLAGSCEMTVG